MKRFSVLAWCLVVLASCAVEEPGDIRRAFGRHRCVSLEHAAAPPVLGQRPRGGATGEAGTDDEGMPIAACIGAVPQVRRVARSVMGTSYAVARRRGLEDEAGRRQTVQIRRAEGRGDQRRAGRGEARERTRAVAGAADGSQRAARDDEGIHLRDQRTQTAAHIAGGQQELHPAVVEREAVEVACEGRPRPNQRVTHRGR